MVRLNLIVLYKCMLTNWTLFCLNSCFSLAIILQDCSAVGAGVVGVVALLFAVGILGRGQGFVGVGAGDGDYGGYYLRCYRLTV